MEFGSIAVDAELKKLFPLFFSNSTHANYPAILPDSVCDGFNSDQYDMHKIILNLMVLNVSVIALYVASSATIYVVYPPSLVCDNIIPGLIPR